MSTVPTTGEIFSRTVAFAQASRWAVRPAPELLVEHFSAFRVLITGAPAVLMTSAGQQAAAFLVNLVGRFCPNVEVDAANHELLPGLAIPLLQGENLGDALSRIPDLIWGPAKPSVVRKPPDLVVSLGPPPSWLSGTPCIQLSFGHWWGAVAEGPNDLPPPIASRQDLGPLVATSLGASSVFKAALRTLADRYPYLANDHTRWDLQSTPLCLSLLDYSLRQSDFPVTVGGVEFPWPVVVVSAGAISSAVGYGLRVTDLIFPAAAIFEPKLIDPPDLNRYVTATVADLDRPKTAVLADWLLSASPVECRIERFSGEPGSRGTSREEVLVAGVDHVPSRWVAQGCWPHHLLIGATEHDQLRVSVHRSPLGGAACARCVDDVDSPTTQGEVIPSISFVSALTGLSLAGELVKLTSAELAEYRLKGLAGGRLLQLGPWTWDVRTQQRNPACLLCRDQQAAA